MKKYSVLLLAALLLTAPKLQAQNARKFYRTGEDFIEAGNYKDAVEQLTKAIEMEPDMDRAYIARAHAYRELDELRLAAEDYDRASTFMEKSPEVFYEAGYLYYQLEDYGLAIDRLDKTIALKRSFLEAYQVKARVYIAQENYPEALTSCNLALTLKETTDNYYYRGVVHEAMNEMQMAESDYEAAVVEDRNNVKALMALADLRVRSDKTNLALQHINRAIGLEDKNADALVIRSKAYVNKLDYPRAIDDISKAILLNPEDPQLYYRRGVYYLEFTQHGNAINDFTKVLMLQEDHADALYKRASSYEEVARYEDAIMDYEKLVALSAFNVEAQILLKEADDRLFELYREEEQPLIQILEPAPKDELVLAFPMDSRLVSLKGKLLDKSEIASLIVDGLEIATIEAEAGVEFMAAVDIENKENLLIEATDVYGNTASINYVINLTEVNPPTVSIIAPYASDNGELFLDSEDPNLYIEGRIEDESQISSILINGVTASYIPNELNPTFSANLNITNQSRITVVVTDQFDNVTESEFRLNKEAALIAANNPMGKTWAVFIENANYQSFASLDGPGKDITLMRTALAKYQVHNVIVKRNMDKSSMEKFFSIELRDLVRSNRVNSLLIWYAGHGKFINEAGYWIPTDAERDDEFTYFNINALKASLQSYSSQVTHTLVITDACESGPSFYQAMRSIPRERSCEDWEATQFKSSQVFSSAGYELAVDNSQFTRTFANSLANNPDACIPIESIVSKVTTAVVSNNQQKPQFGKIDGLEDEDGTFFFISKEY